jgi:hypothetical protein
MMMDVMAGCAWTQASAAGDRGLVRFGDDLEFVDDRVGLSRGSL